MTGHSGITAHTINECLAFDSDTVDRVREIARTRPDWNFRKIFEEFTAVCPICYGPMAEDEAVPMKRICKDMDCGLELSYWTARRLLTVRQM